MPLLGRLNRPVPADSRRLSVPVQRRRTAYAYLDVARVLEFSFLAAMRREERRIQLCNQFREQSLLFSICQLRKCLGRQAQRENKAYANVIPECADGGRAKKIPQFRETFCLLGRQWNAAA